MYCPTCGTETATDKRFCRNCGMDLNPVSQLVTGQPANATTTPNLLYPDMSTDSPSKKVRRLGILAMIGGVLLAMVLSILGGALTNLDDGVGSFVASLSGLGGMVFTIGIGVFIYSRFLSKTPVASNPTPTEAIPPAQPNLQMPPAQFGQRVSSVTENTTELLDPDEERARVRR